jgi:sugar/nucleoside kinase (ribokinase family)
VTGADRLLYVGQVVVDVVLTVPGLPERGGDLVASAGRSAPGGGFNVLAAAARQGLPAVYAGLLGTGPFAALATAGLAAEGIEAPHPPRPDLDTGIVVSLIDPGGERTFVTSPGAEATLTATDLRAVPATGRDIVAVSGYGLIHPSNRAAIADWLPGLPPSAVLVFDPGPLVGRIPAPSLDAVLDRADWLTVNQREAAILAGQADPAAAAATLARRTGRAGVLVRTGPGGCLLARPGAAPVPVPGFPVRAVDTSGAGDAHTGVFIAALARGADPARAARAANAAAALAVTRPGPATAPTSAELTAFLGGPP